MNSNEIRRTFLDFFEKRGHKIVPSSSLIPDDPSVLLTTAGMQQFKPYYIGKADALKDFGSLNVASVQKSFRTSDIDEVGDESHLTFFEMLGNFSFGGYFSANGGSAYGGKKDAIKYGYDFFKEIGLPIEFVTVFGGDSQVPADEESEKIWRELGITDIRRKGREDNFWGPTGSEGPCGPTTEIYINGVEIWNIVFNQYYCKPDKTLAPLEKPGVDTGMGLERLAMVLQKKKNIFETDLFDFATLLRGGNDDITRRARIIADHLRASVFLLADGVRPSNKGAGYILRRIIRRLLVHRNKLSLKPEVLEEKMYSIINQYGDFYEKLKTEKEKIIDEFGLESDRFILSMERGVKEFYKQYPELKALPIYRGSASNVIRVGQRISGIYGFNLYQTFGLTPDIIKDLAQESGNIFDEEEFNNEFKKHQEISRAGIEKKFGGHGLLLDTGELKAADEEELKKVTRLHTATHLLNAALRKVLNDPNIRQNGSDITAERTRFDFSFPRKLTADEIKKIEDAVNDVIGKDYEVVREEMPYQNAVQSGAFHFFREKYPERVSVYTVRDAKTGDVFSKELCGGPHISHTGEIGNFKIVKEESSSAGVRRIRAMVE